MKPTLACTARFCVGRDQFIFGRTRGFARTLLDAKSSFGAEVGRFSTTFCRSCSHVLNATFEEDRVGYTQRYDSSAGVLAAFCGV
jgi:hypothetical protein